MQNSPRTHNFFGVLTDEGYERGTGSTARKGLVEITLRCHPPAFDLMVRPAYGYTWIPTRVRHIDPLVTPPRDAAEIALSLGADLLRDIDKSQRVMAHD
ncbi:MAG: hypothetical protein GIW99_10300 [Candidatus Eremiobacteraeota bacterium]|nr:hypothetical protein [Candidatus Eremiobacteraeota bacterium]MBC5828052.1 hypothetical protein [Candidatus Eremiobacteraeota bacterium]